LVATAEQKRQAGEWDAYWDLTAPGNRGDLYTLIGQEQDALDYYRDAARYFDDYKAWLLAQKREWVYTSIEADYYLKARLYPQARAVYEVICNAPTSTDKSVHAIALINSGAVERGRGYLDWRIKNFDFGNENTAPRWYHLGECHFWKGDYANALVCLARGMQNWQNPDPPALGLMHLTRYIAERNATDRDMARQAFEASIRWFYREGETERAFDAHEYLQLLAAFEQNKPVTGLRIRGISFLRV
jgi:tetratricopeptide (TPR) repeat protein